MARVVWGALGEWIARPTAQLGAVGLRVTEVQPTSGQLSRSGHAGSPTSARTVRAATSPSSPLNSHVCSRNGVTVALPRLRTTAAACPLRLRNVNDVVLAVVAGRGVAQLADLAWRNVTATSTVRAMAPSRCVPRRRARRGGMGQAISEVSPFWSTARRRGNAGCGCRRSTHATDRMTASQRRRRPDPSSLCPGSPHRSSRHGIRVADQFRGPSVQTVITHVPERRRRCTSAGNKLLGEPIAVASASAQPGEAIGAREVLNGMPTRRERRPKMRERRRHDAHHAARTLDELWGRRADRLSRWCVSTSRRP